jgi:TolB-like protein/Tfp pilus assembly protein PilF
MARTKTAQTRIKELNRGNTLAGRYEIIEELGKGGMGNVYRVLDKKINEEIALKLIKPTIATDENIIERFRNELKFARKITHKNVCRMYDLNEEEEILYITMEYVLGDDLKSIIIMMGQLSIGKAISIAKQICEGLEEAHRLGVVHRDLKPRNIMIDKEGNALIMDFGIARSLKTKGITSTGDMIGTPEYISPEQAEGKETDPRSDIYSLGVIIFEMVTGRVPFKGDTSLSIALKHKTEIPPDPREFNTQIPVDLSCLILKCMEKDKEKRYQGSADLFSDLNKIEKEIPTKYRVIPRRKPRIGIQRKPFLTFLLPGTVLIAAIMFLGYLFLDRILETGGMKERNSIAVLPFEDTSQNQDQGPFCEEMTMAVIIKLSSCEGLKVIPYRTMSRYKDKVKSNREIGEELDIKTIIVPYLKKEKEKIYITAQLVDANQDFVIKSFEYDEKFENVFEVQDKLSQDIADALDVPFIAEKLKTFKQREPKNTEAYKSYMKGKYFDRRYQDSNGPKDFEAAVKNYEKAIETEGDFALVYWGLGNIYQARFVDEDKWKDFELMVKNYMKAYQINQDLAETNVGLGWSCFYKGDWDEAFKYYKRALELEPTNPEVNYYVAGFFKDIGLYRKAIEFYSKAIEIDPTYAEYRDVCAQCYMKIGEYEKAIDLLKEALEFEPDDASLRLFYARQLIMMKKYDEAKEEIARVEEFNPDKPGIQYSRAYIFALKGEKEKALAIIKDLNPYYLTHLISSVYSILGMKDEAIENIQEVIDKGFYKLQTYPYSYHVLIKNYFYDNLRDDPRFKEIVKKEKKKYQEKLKKYADI